MIQVIIFGKVFTKLFIFHERDILCSKNVLPMPSYQAQLFFYVGPQNMVNECASTDWEGASKSYDNHPIIIKNSDHFPLHYKEPWRFGTRSRFNFAIHGLEDLKNRDNTFQQIGGHKSIIPFIYQPISRDCTPQDLPIGVYFTSRIEKAIHFKSKICKQIQYTYMLSRSQASVSKCHTM